MPSSSLDHPVFVFHSLGRAGAEHGAESQNHPRDEYTMKGTDRFSPDVCAMWLPDGLQRMPHQGKVRNSSGWCISSADSRNVLKTVIRGAKLQKCAFILKSDCDLIHLVEFDFDSGGSGATGPAPNVLHLFPNASAFASLLLFQCLPHVLVSSGTSRWILPAFYLDCEFWLTLTSEYFQTEAQKTMNFKKLPVPVKPVQSCSLT